jgi:hypothetical protein
MRTAKKAVNMAAALLMVFALYGCGQEAGEGSAPSSAPPPAPAQATGFADIKLAMAPYPPVALKDTVMTATVTDENDKPLTGADVVFDLSMPSMYHGENRPAAKETAPGVYSAKGIFTMGGKWLVKVEVKDQGIDVTREFPVEAVGE